MRCIAKVGGLELPLEVSRRSRGRCSVRSGADRPVVEARAEGATVVVHAGGRPIEAVVARLDGNGGAERICAVTIAGRLYEVRLTDPLRAGQASGGLRRTGPAEVRAIMPGKVIAILAQAGDAVRAGQGILVIEAMKMENELPAPRDGRLAALRVRQGDTVETGAPLFTVE